tara:strand:+ start:290 stop:886 length:597 start_codon:yes stop_codon:yes gene_type:complete
MPKQYKIDSKKYKTALDFSFNLYKDKVRKGSNTPYFTYLSSVSNLIIENNGSTDEAIAGLLHDAYELNSHKSFSNKISNKFGVRVSNIVKQCSNEIGVNVEVQNWINQKKEFLDNMNKKSQSSLFVCLCDKLHGVSCMISDHSRIGKKLWKQFIAKPDQIIWYYRSLCKNFKKSLRNHKNLKDKFQRNVNELEYLVKK